ncbi:MAG: protein phosphatase 2C domain-containing protein [Xenococcaceae cyanobacterium MO_167.B27]|nr:protein phosphatase 2C domain-containing protein [Xenococcaceae cyanobacterium MO_167.B27]
MKDLIEVKNSELGTQESDDQDLIIKEKICFCLGEFRVEVIAYLGLLTADVHYFKVKLQSSDSEPNIEQFGLLRVGSIDSSLNRELKLRETLGDYAMIAKLLAYTTVESVLINPHSILSESENNQEEQKELENTSLNGDRTYILEENADSVDTDTEAISTGEDTVIEEKLENIAITQHISDAVLKTEVEENSGYLEEEYYPEQQISIDESKQKLLFLTDFPEESGTLATWLEEKHSTEEYLSIAIQICQFASYLYQRQWCFVNLLPQLIEIGKPLKFFDLTTAYPVDESLSSGLIGNYCAPELSAAHNIQESMASYTVGALLYQCFHQQPPSNQELDLKIEPIPRIYQLLKIALSPISEERFALSQLLSLLVETRNLFRVKKIQWQVASNSTLGLSTSRLTNEDNYGVRQQQLSDLENLIMGVVADGMGGMAQGEVASQIAVKTLLEEPITQNFPEEESRANWLVDLFQKANESITNRVKDGGTTLSAVLAMGDRLMVAHVGDSRIYLIRQGEISQLSEDHSLVAMMVASGQISLEESLEHPDRNVLTKSLGSKRILSDGYVQDLRRIKQKLSMTLEDGDILLLCSDGVWDLVSTDEIGEIFAKSLHLQSAVDATIKQVLYKGASDNATLLALQCSIETAN